MTSITKDNLSEKGKYKYFAFISYSREDEKWAKWLHSKIETYRVPRKILQSKGEPLPRRLSPIFRDKDELPASSDLGATLKERLTQSRYLIVLCSPRAASSKWVNEEISFFKQLGRSDKILSLIVDGEPNASEQGDLKNECFPPALLDDTNGKKHSPLAADIRPGKDKKSAARIRILAALLGIEYAILNNRERKRKRKRFIFYATTLLLIGTGTGLLSWLTYEAQIKAEQNAKIALSRKLSQTAIQQLKQKPDVALLLSAQAWHTARTSEARVALWQTHLPRLRAILHGHRGRVNALVFDDTGHWLASGGNDETALLWDTTTLKTVQRVVLAPVTGAEGGLNFVKRVGFASEFGIWAIDALYNAPKEDLVRNNHSSSYLHDADENKPLIFPLPNNSNKQRLAKFTTKDLSHIKWNDSFAKPETIESLKQWTDSATSFDQSTNNMVAIGRLDGTIQIWETSLALQKLAHSAWYSPKGDFIIFVTPDGKFSLWDIKGQIWRNPPTSFKAVINLDKNEDTLGRSEYKIAVSTDQRWLAWIDINSGIYAWDLSQDAVHLLAKVEGKIEEGAVVFSRDSTKVGTFCVTDNGDEIKQWYLHDKPTIIEHDLDLDWRLYGWDLIFQGYDGGGVYAESRNNSVWGQTTMFYGIDYRNKRKWRMLELTQHAFPYRIAISDSLLVIAHCIGMRYQYGPECSGTRLSAFGIPRSSEEQPMLASTWYESHTHPLDSLSKDTLPKSWKSPNLDWGLRVVKNLNDTQPPEQLLFTPDGKWLIGHSGLREIRFWNSENLEPDAILENTFGEISNLSINPKTGNELLVVSKNGRTIQLNLNPDVLAMDVCRVVGRNLSREEWVQYVGNYNGRLVPYKKTCQAYDEYKMLSMPVQEGF